jgi:hypothetical protein
MLQLLTPPTAADFHRITLDPAHGQQARKIINTLQHLAQTVAPLSIIKIAQGLNPDKSVGEALDLMQVDAERALAAVKLHDGQFKAVSNADRKRLAPIQNCAVRRARDIQHQLGVLQGTSHCLDVRVEARREKLKEAGIEQAEIERLVPQISPEQAAELAAQVESLNAELASLEAFLKTSDERLLPAGFVVTEPL